jgi:ribose transport system substrate-binding protein
MLGATPRAVAFGLAAVQCATRNVCEVHMKRIQAMGSAVLFAVLAIGLSGCEKHAGEKYFFVTTNKQVPYWQTARAGFDDAAIKMKVGVDFVGPDNYDPQAELEAFRNAVKSKPSGILVSPADPNLFKPEIDAAVAQGIPVLTVDSDAPGSKRLFFVGTNNYQAGVMGGEAAAKALNGKGTVIVFTMPNQTNLEERLAGYRAAFAKYPDIKIDRVVDIKGDPRIAFDTTQSIVDKREKIDGFLCLEAMAGKEVAAVLSQDHVTGRTIVAMDTDPDTLDWVQKGMIAATVAQKPYTMGYFGLRVLDSLHHQPPTALDHDWKHDPHSEMPAFVDTGVALVDKSNVNVFRPKK